MKKGWTGREHHLRSLAKAVTYRVAGSLVTGIAAYVFTGDGGAAVSIGFVDMGAKIGLFYLHERVWEKVRFGKPKEPEYEI